MIARLGPCKRSDCFDVRSIRGSWVFSLRRTSRARRGVALRSGFMRCPAQAVSRVGDGRTTEQFSRVLLETLGAKSPACRKPQLGGRAARQIPTDLAP